MPSLSAPADHPKVAIGKVGVLLVNLGTPDAPTPKAVRRYLAEFLSDQRVVEIPPIAWKPILHGIILRTRPAKSAHAYQQVWTDEGSPLAAITAAQARALQALLGDGVHVDWGMRYGNPSIASRLQGLKNAGCERVLIAPLYPQYSGATTASVIDKVSDVLRAMRWQPSLRTAPPYYDDAAYIDALEQDIYAQIQTLSFVPDVLLLSYHGMPQRTLELGDPYYCHCNKTSRLLQARLVNRLPSLRIETSFQSRFGRAKWLEPATETVLEQEAKAGTKRIAIAAPGFAADCVETLEELELRGREVFAGAGGQEFAVLTCLNDSIAGMKMMDAIIRRELQGWWA